jgi:hypothetical protein
MVTTKRRNCLSAGAINVNCCSGKFSKHFADGLANRQQMSLCLFKPCQIYFLASKRKQKGILNLNTNHFRDYRMAGNFNFLKQF